MFRRGGTYGCCGGVLQRRATRRAGSHGPTAGKVVPDRAISAANGREATHSGQSSGLRAGYDNAMSRQRTSRNEHDSRPTCGVLQRLAKSKFRAKFRLSDRDVSQVRRRGEGIIRMHAHDLISARLAPAHPKRDGKQTPFRGHPVFVAQHATATCCRSCLEKWHGVAKGQPMSDKQIEAAVGVVMAWIEQEVAQRPGRAGAGAGGREMGGKSADPQPGLFD